MRNRFLKLVKWPVAILFLGFLYYLFGMAGLLVESEVKGITPIWPPSGLTIAAVMIFGYRLLPGIAVGVLLLVAQNGFSWQIALLTSIGGIIEAALPVALLRKTKFDGKFHDISDVLAFSTFAVIVGPICSATFGAVAFTQFNSAVTLNFSEIWLLWWLGNSLGIIVIGGFFLEWYRTSRLFAKEFWVVIAIAALSAVICYFSLNRVDGVYSTLLLLTIIPLTVLSALYCEVKGSTFLAFAILLMFISSGGWLPSEVFGSPDISYFYLNSLFIVVNAFIGMLAGASIRKHRELISKEKKYSEEVENLVTERTADLERAQKQLLLAHKSRALSTLSGGIAHEFNNLLTPILCYSEMLYTMPQYNEEHRRYIRSIHDAGKRAEDLVRQIMVYGQNSNEKKQAVQMDVLVNEIVNIVQHAAPSNITIAKNIEGKRFYVNAIPNKIHQMILNLCINSYQAMPEGGVLSIQLKKDVKPSVASLEHDPENKDFVCLSVKDTGAGIPKENIKYIFDPFYTTREVGEGSGLGLSVVQGVVEYHDGYIEVDSKSGVGTVFNIYLPTLKEIADDVEETKTADVESNQFVGKKMNGVVVVLDDEMLIINLIKDGLEGIGYTVKGFTRSDEALNWLKQHISEVAVIIADYDTPAIDGDELMNQIELLRADTPFIVMAGYSEFLTGDHSQLLTKENVIFKPFDLGVLRHVVNTELATRITPEEEASAER